MNLKKHILRGKVIFALLTLSFSLSSQDLLISEKNLGANVALNLAFGTHFQRLGFNLNFFYVNDFFQANSEVRVYINFKNLGPKKMYPELVLSQGVVFGYGGRRNIFNPFISSISNQTGYISSFAYSYNAWFNTVKTRQQTGIVAFQFDQITLIAENDILARGYYDRFRTGGFLLQFQYEDKFQAGINCTLWTGQMGNQVHGDSVFKAVCYMDTTGGRYSQYSHGLLSAQFKYSLDYSQNVQASVGVDAERVRNFMQNRIIHDYAFLPRKWVKPKNCHIPMIDDKGRQYLYREEQKIKPKKVYLNIFSNANLFY